MSASADIANFQMSNPFLIWGRSSFKPGRLCSEEGRLFEESVHLDQGALPDNYDKTLIKNLIVRQVR